MSSLWWCVIIFTFALIAYFVILYWRQREIRRNVKTGSISGLGLVIVFGVLIILSMMLSGLLKAAENEMYSWMALPNVVGPIFLILLESGRIRKGRRRIRNTCPQCLGVYTMRKYSNSKRAVLFCQNDIDDHESCDFHVRDSRRDYHQLSLPAVGTTSGSGTSSWLIVLHELINNGFGPDALELHHLPSPMVSNVCRRA